MGSPPWSAAPERARGRPPGRDGATPPCTPGAPSRKGPEGALKLTHLLAAAAIALLAATLGQRRPRSASPPTPWHGVGAARLRSA